MTDTTARFTDNEWMKLPKHPHYAICPSVCSIERMRRHPDRWHPKRMKPTRYGSAKTSLQFWPNRSKRIPKLKWHCHFRQEFLQFRHTRQVTDSQWLMNPVQRALNNGIAQEKQAFLVDIGFYMRRGSLEDTVKRLQPDLFQEQTRTFQNIQGQIRTTRVQFKDKWIINDRYYSKVHR